MDPRGKEDTLSYSEKIKAFQEELAKETAYRATHRRREDEVSESYAPERVFGGNENMNATPKAPSVLEQNYQYLADNIERLFSQVENLELRLRVILTDSDPETAKDSMGYAGNTAFSEKLAQLCRKTQDLSDRLSYLTARIDL